jgi:hypothetical protein
MNLSKLAAAIRAKHISATEVLLEKARILSGLLVWLREKQQPYQKK